MVIAGTRRKLRASIATAPQRVATFVAHEIVRF